MDKIALVTGGNRGIGFETCRQLGQHGFFVILSSRDPQLGQNAALELSQGGLNITHQKLDVTSLEEIEENRDFVIDQFGRLDVLVNNAGVYFDGHKNILEVDCEVIEKTMAINFYGPLHLTRAFTPLMKVNNYGRIVNVSSTGGSISVMGTGSGNWPSYRISKAALNALTRLTAATVKDYNIKVNAMCPGWVRTRMGSAGAPRDVKQGVDTILWLATLPASGPTGGFYKDREKHPW
ncbi:MAG: SDR family oxidoreductase [Anaerolineales bacterium]|jgi:NAD(P)-dependent dehydrogenase (short-subunit alcohol dehydrogenase family)